MWTEEWHYWKNCMEWVFNAKNEKVQRSHLTMMIFIMQNNKQNLVTNTISTCTMFISTALWLVVFRCSLSAVFVYAFIWTPLQLRSNDSKSGESSRHEWTMYWWSSKQMSIAHRVHVFSTCSNFLATFINRFFFGTNNWHEWMLTFGLFMGIFAFQ